jgi:phosphoribosylformylglycinamidine synthase
MATPRALVLRTAGTNCDLETEHALARAGFAVEKRHVNEWRADPSLLERYQLLALPGGFSHGDDLGAGKVLANELRLHLMAPLERLVERGGLVIGICNGFQTLVKAGLLPATRGLPAPGAPYAPEATLARNDSGLFEARWIRLACESDRTPFLRRGDVFELPTAHGEGRFVPASEDVRARLLAQGQVVLRYVGPDGAAAPPYPWNPSGSADAIAGVCDASGRIFGLMPHPERNVEFHHHPRWTREGYGPGREGDGLRVFRNAFAHLAS